MLPCMIIAKAKNKSMANAFFASLFFGLFALIYYIFAKREPEESKEDTFKCPKCKASIEADDEFCPDCGANIQNKKGKKHQ